MYYKCWISPLEQNPAHKCEVQPPPNDSARYVVQEPTLITLKDSETGMAIKAEREEQMRGKRTCKHLIRVLETLIVTT